MSVRRKSEREWATRFVGVLLGIWRQQNEFIFRGKKIPPNILTGMIKEEVELWLKCVNSRGSNANDVQRANFIFQSH